MRPELADALQRLEGLLAARQLTLESTPVEYGAKLTVSAADGRSLHGTLYFSTRKSRFTLTLPPSDQRDLVETLGEGAQTVCDARVSGGQAALVDRDAPASGIREIDELLVVALPRMHAAGLFPESMDPIAHGLKLVFPAGKKPAVVSIYHSRKKGLSVVPGGGPGKAVAQQVAALLRPEPALPEEELALSRWAGTDEAGKGDYFGPLVTCGVVLDTDLAEEIVGMGAMDSKRLAGGRIESLARTLRRVLGDRAATVVVEPQRYNQLYEQMRARGQKLNHMLAWCHGRVVKDLAERRHPFDAVVVDRFASRSLIQRSIPAGIELIARPRAEDNPAVAAASILARDTYVRRLQRLSDEIGLQLTPGAGPPVIRTGKKVVERHGADALGRIGKLHFRTTETILG
ncbi:MAG: ribonuclease HIII [Myxococcota bacterium]|nr:ribonuclease HIII [Myxococcota bacterium]